MYIINGEKVMNKTVKISFICAFLFAFVNVQAQVIESVSFTPAKTGNYKTIATKSVTSFKGNLTADNVTAHGYELYLRAGVYPFADGINISSGKDTYMSEGAKITNTNIGSGGKIFVSSENVTIKDSILNTIHGRNVDFPKTEGLLTYNGILDLQGVKMRNPRCDIKWIKLLAYRLVDNETEASGNPRHYWFAYCADEDVNVNEEEPEVTNDWTSTRTTFNGLSTCLAHNGNCTDTCTGGEANCPAHHIYHRYFECTNPVVYKCNTPYNTVNMFNGRIYADNYHQKNVWSGVSGQNGWCDGSIRYYPATIFWYGGNVQEIVPYPIDTEIQKATGTNGVTAINLAEATLRPYCGLTFNKMGDNSSHYISYAQDAYELMANNPWCTHGEALPLCYQMANKTYDAFNTWRTSFTDDELCKQIVNNNSTLTNVNTFSCILNPTSPTGHTYFKTTNTRIVSEQRRPCHNNNICHSSGNNTNFNIDINTGDYCKYRDAAQSFNVNTYPENYIVTSHMTYSGNGREAGVTASIDYDNQSGNVAYNAGTYYLNKKIENAIQLNCFRQ